MFRFKQFTIDQTGCAMKINTDGVLLGALTEADNPQSILDIGTGTGVIALMLAQRFGNAKIDAVEIDGPAAETAGKNFANSSFAGRVDIFPTNFEDFFHQHTDKKYDLIISNPPFYINSLKSPQKGRRLAKHADQGFFERLLGNLIGRLTERGVCCMILPMDTAALVKNISQMHGLLVKRQINIYSYKESDMHRQILFLSNRKTDYKETDFIIYDEPGVHSAGYRVALRDFFTIF